MLTIKTCVPLILLIRLSNLSHGSLLTKRDLFDMFFDDFGLWHRKNMFDLVNWDPFDDDPFEIDFFKNRDLYFPRIYWARTTHPIRVPKPLMTRNDKQSFQLSIDVKGFDPKELSLKLVGRELLITGDFTYKQNQNKACFQRRFCWRRTLPEDVDLSSVKATVTDSNMLEIEANKKQAFESYIPIAVRETPGNQRQHQTNNKLEQAQEVRPEQAKKMEEEATVEIIPDETEAMH